MIKKYPWYWAWRGWRASTWLFLLWSALVWPQVATMLRDQDEWLFARQTAAVFIIFWFLGVVFIGMARAFASLERAKWPPRAEGSLLGDVVRSAAPFVAIVLLGVILAGPHV